MSTYIECIMYCIIVGLSPDKYQINNILILCLTIITLKIQLKINNVIFKVETI